MEIENQAANTEPNEPVAPAEPSQEPTEPQNPEPVAEPEPQEPTQTQAFARRLQEERSKIEAGYEPDKKLASEAKRIATALGYKSAEEMIAAVDKQAIEQEAVSKGIDPEVYAQMTAAQREAAEAKRIAEEAKGLLSVYERKEALAKLADSYGEKYPKWAQFFKDNRAQIMDVANNIEGNGMTPEAHLDFARMYVFNEKYEPPNMEALKQQHIKEYQDSLRNQPPAEGRGGGTSSTPHASTGNVWRDREAMARKMLEGATQ
jgi:hypothetical protein